MTVNGGLGWPRPFWCKAMPVRRHATEWLFCVGPGLPLYAGEEKQRGWTGRAMAIDVGYASAITAGAISFLSPCVLPLVPPYLCYMAGVSVEDFRAEPRAAGGPGGRPLSW